MHAAGGFGTEETETIRRHLDRVLASEIFAHAARQSRFLRFVVEETLAGRSQRLKGYTIGIEVFDRAADFDPTCDSIVRVEAGRLRAKLREYYGGPGRGDAVRIELPKGSYVPRIDTPAPATVPDGRARHAVAVLPFVNLSADPRDERLADGVTDTLINHLARRADLAVTSFTSVMRYKSAGRSLPAIARELDVDRVVEGTLMRQRERLRISAQLIDAVRDRHLWASAFDCRRAAILDSLEDMTAAICAVLSGAAAPAQPAARGPIGWDAYEACMTGRHFRMQLTEDAVEKGIAYFNRALELEPDYAEACAGLAGCYCTLGTLGVEARAPHEVIPRGIALARRAIELDERCVEAHAFLGIMLLKYAWDWPGARRCFERALELAPNDVRTLVQYGLYFESLGAHARAVEFAERARRIDPLSRMVNLNLGWQYHQAGAAGDAQRAFERLMSIDPGFWGAWWGLGHVHREAGRYERAVTSFRRAVDAGGGPLALEGLGHALAVAGAHREALEIAVELEKRAARSYVSPCRIATIHAGLGDRQALYTWLERAFAARARSLAWLPVMREYAPYRAEPPMRALLERIRPARA